MAIEDINTFRNMLRINRNRLDDELEVQAEIMDRICNKITRLNARQIELKHELEKLAGRIAIEAKEDNPKMIKDEIEGVVKKDREYIAAWKAYQLARAEHEEWEHLLDAWKGRGRDIKTLADLFQAQYWAQDVSYGDRPHRAPRENPRETVERARERRSINDGEEKQTAPRRERRSLL